MERMTRLEDLIARATKDEGAAGEEILSRLASGNQEEQLETLRALCGVADSAFWERILEYLATGRWGGSQVQSAAGKASRQALQTRIQALFVAAPLEVRAGRAREKALVRALSSPNVALRAVSADLAGISGSPLLVEPLIAAVKDGPGRVQVRAIRALGRLGDERAVPVLIEALQSDDELLAALARDVLVTIGPPAVEPLARALDSVESSEQVRWMAARALARIADRRAIPALVAHLNDPNYGVRWLCADGLVALKDDGLRAVLRTLETEEITPWLADAAAHVLRHAQPHAAKEIVKPVLDMLHSIDAAWAVPAAAGKALGELTPKGLA